MIAKPSVREEDSGMLRKTLYALAALLLLLVLYLGLWPVPIDPVVWTPPPNPGYTGPHASNTRLADLQTIDLGEYEGPEDVELASDGRLLLAVDHGVILELTPQNPEKTEWKRRKLADTGGRPLGLALPPRGATLPDDWTEQDLVVADAYRGLLRVKPDGAVEVLADEVPGAPEERRAIRYADNVDIASDGRMYFSDASTRFGAEEYGGTFEASIFDILEHRKNGRILVYNPNAKTKEERTTELLYGFSFPNGIALDKNEASFFFAETGEYQILRHWIKGPRAGETEVVLESLPGYPDNVNRGQDGRYWVGLTKPRSELLDNMADSPFLRKVTLRLPDAIKPIPPSYGHVFAFNENGEIVRDLQDPEGAYPSATGASEAPGRLYIQSLHAKGRLGYVALEP